MSEISEIKLSYNRLSALLVAIANAFTLAYVGQMNLYDAVWYGSVSGAFTFVILSNANMDHYDWDARRGSASPRSERPQSMSYPMPTVPTTSTSDATTTYATTRRVSASSTSTKR